MNPCIGLYLPPKGVCNSDAIVANLLAAPPKLPLLIVTDAAGDWAGLNLDRCEVVPMRARPEDCVPQGTPKWPAISNLVFLTTMRVAGQRGYTHVLYIEADCRFVDGWDTAMWEEYQSHGNPNAIAGTVVLYHVSQLPHPGPALAAGLLKQNRKKNVPVSEYGRSNAKTNADPAVFPNGAIAIYPVDLISSIFGTERTVARAIAMSAYDHEIGWEMVRRHGGNIFHHVIQLDCVFSTYKEQVVSAAELREMLTSNKVVAIHPVKDDWLPDDMAANPVVDHVSTNKPEVTASVDILIASHAKDVWWLEQCLRSIDKFATGFREVHVAVPDIEKDAFKGLANAKVGKAKLVWHFLKDTKEGKGHLEQMIWKCSADLMSNADFITHIDSDCVFRQSVNPDDYFHKGKPVLLIESFDHLKSSHPGRFGWKQPVDEALGGDCKFETMCRHPAVHYRNLYPELRCLIAVRHNATFQDYVLSRRDTFPYGFAEFPTLGAMALSDAWKEKYHFIDVTKNRKAYPPDKLIQFWSHGHPDEPQTIWNDGRQKKLVPSVVIRKLLGK